MEEAEKNGRLEVGNGRTVCYATSGADRGEWAVLFLPLGVSRLFVYRKELSESAQKLGLRLVGVDRPDIGGTSGCSEEDVDKNDETTSWGGSLGGGSSSSRSKRSKTVSRRLRTHSNDVAAVLAHLGASNVRVIGICAGTPFALHFVATHAGLASTYHISLVTPWVQPYDCEYAWSLARLASRRWILGRSLAGYLLSSLQLGLAVPMLRSLDPGELLALLDGKLTEKERLELQATRARQAADILVASRGQQKKKFLDHKKEPAADAYEQHQQESAKQNRAANKKQSSDHLFQAEDEELVQDLERRLELALGARAIEYMGENAQAHCVVAMTADVRVCLSSLDEVLQGRDLKDLPIDSATLLAADDDELVPPKAARWLADRLPGHVGLFVFHRSSHAGVQTLRRNEWLKVAATHGAALPSPTELNIHLSDDPRKRVHSANIVARPSTNRGAFRGLFNSSSATFAPPPPCQTKGRFTNLKEQYDTRQSVAHDSEDTDSFSSADSVEEIPVTAHGFFGSFFASQAKPQSSSRIASH